MLTYFLWLKAYVAFNDLHNLKILLCECKMSFECEIYWETAYAASAPPPLCGEQRSAPNFELGEGGLRGGGGGRKNNCVGGFKEFFPQIIALEGELTMFLVKKTVR